MYAVPKFAACSWGMKGFAFRDYTLIRAQLQMYHVTHGKDSSDCIKHGWQLQVNQFVLLCQGSMKESAILMLCDAGCEHSDMLVSTGSGLPGQGLR